MILHTSPNGRMHLGTLRPVRPPPRVAPRPAAARPAEPQAAAPKPELPAAAPPAPPAPPAAAPPEVEAPSPPTTPELHLQAHEEGWAVVAPRSEEPLILAPTKQHAVRKAKALAKRRGALLHVHTRAGKLQRTLDFTAAAEA